MARARRRDNAVAGRHIRGLRELFRPPTPVRRAAARTAATFRRPSLLSLLIPAEPRNAAALPRVRMRDCCFAWSCPWSRFPGKARADAQRAAADNHHGRRSGPCSRARLPRRPAQNSGAGRLSAGRGADWPVHPGVRRERRDCRRTRRDRRDAADVRRRSALVVERPFTGTKDRPAGRPVADRGRHRARGRGGRELGLDPRSRADLRPDALDGKHRRVAAGAGSARHPPLAGRNDRCRLAGRRGSRHGRRARGAAAVGGVAGRRRAGQRRRQSVVGPRHYLYQSGRLYRPDAGGRAPLFPIPAVAGRAHRFARAVYSLRRRRRCRHRIRRQRAFRRFVRARRLFRRNGDARIRAQPSRRRGVAPAARRVFRPLLRFRRGCCSIRAS